MTRKLALVLLLVVLVGAPCPLAAYPFKDTLNFLQVVWGWDDTVKRVAPVSVNATTGAMLVEGDFDISSATVDIAPPSTSSQTVILLSGTDVVIASLAARVSITLTATGTFEYSTGLATVPANTTPCYSASFEAGPDVAIAVKTSATSTYLTVRQLGE